jgi:uncharacterized membrane protein
MEIFKNIKHTFEMICKRFWAVAAVAAVVLFFPHEKVYLTDDRREPNFEQRLKAFRDCFGFQELCETVTYYHKAVIWKLLKK